MSPSGTTPDGSGASPTLVDGWKDDFTTELLFEIELQLMREIRPPWAIGATPRGDRFVGGIIGGSFEGPAATGAVAPLGADFAWIRPDDVLTPKVDLILEPEGDAPPFALHYEGMVSPWSEVQGFHRGADVDVSQIDWTVVGQFDVPEGPHEWLNRVIAVGRGRIVGARARYRFFRLV